MTGRLAAVVLALAAAGCSTTDVISTDERAPPSLDRAIADLADDGCAEFWSSEQGSVRLQKGEIEERCPAVYPDVLQRAGIEGGCRSMFDLTDDGQVVNLETRCRVQGAWGDHRDEWIAFSEALLAASVDRSLAAYRVAPDALSEKQLRASLSIVTSFMFEDSAAPEALVPAPFQRVAAQ